MFSFRVWVPSSEDTTEMWLMFQSMLMRTLLIAFNALGREGKSLWHNLCPSTLFWNAVHFSNWRHNQHSGSHSTIDTAAEQHRHVVSSFPWSQLLSPLKCALLVTPHRNCPHILPIISKTTWWDPQSMIICFCRNPGTCSAQGWCQHIGRCFTNW